MSIEKGQSIETINLNNVVGYGVGKKINDFNELPTVNENTVILVENNGVCSKITLNNLKNYFM